MPPMSKVDLFAAIRRDSRAGLSVRALARKVSGQPAHGPFGAEFGVAGAANWAEATGATRGHCAALRENSSPTNAPARST